MIDICFLNWKTEKDSHKKKKYFFDKEFRKKYHSKKKELFFREPPNGILILSAILEKYGYSVDILDCSVTQDPFDLLRSNATKYRVFGITSLTNSINTSLQLAKLAKRNNPNSYILFGGPHVTFEYKNVLKNNPFIDIIFIGESETSIGWVINKILEKPAVDFLYSKDRINISETFNKPGKIQFLLNNSSLPKGIAFNGKLNYDSFLKSIYKQSVDQIYKKYSDFIIQKTRLIDNKNTNIIIENDNNIIFTGFPEPTELNSIPLPSRHLIELVYNVADVIVNRGCPNNCIFCSRTKMFPKLRIRTIEDIKSEINQILMFKNYKFVNFYDNININHKFFNKFLDMLIEMNFPIPWGAELRVDLLTEEEVIKMKNSNCKIIATGVESADPEVLRINFKIQNPNEVKKGIELLKKYNISIQAYFVIGLPGETYKSFSNTLKFLENLHLNSKEDQVEFFVATPYPGSEMASNLDKFGLKIINHNYNQYTCKDIIMETQNLKSSDIKKMIKSARKTKLKLGLK